VVFVVEVVFVRGFSVCVDVDVDVVFCGFITDFVLDDSYDVDVVTLLLSSALFLLNGVVGTMPIVDCDELSVESLLPPDKYFVRTL
tara:strand:- start:63 stop:320 length:258 start_codon:yes stop_codon:yes gene_type:complete